LQLGYVESLQIQRKKGNPFEHVTSVELEALKGIVGDCHALGGEKQIALISSDTKQWITQQEIEGLCFSKFQENIVVDGLEFHLVNEGDILITDYASIEIAMYTKRCFPDCALRQDNKPCELKLGTRFGKVLQSGKIQVGNRIWKANKNCSKSKDVVDKKIFN
jgi:MOSC domain-containing protein YiiM